LSEDKGNGSNAGEGKKGNILRLNKKEGQPLLMKERAPLPLSEERKKKKRGTADYLQKGRKMVRLRLFPQRKKRKKAIPPRGGGLPIPWKRRTDLCQKGRIRLRLQKKQKKGPRRLRKNQCQISTDETEKKERENRRPFSEGKGEERKDGSETLREKKGGLRLLQDGKRSYGKQEGKRMTLKGEAGQPRSSKNISAEKGK